MCKYILYFTRQFVLQCQFCKARNCGLQRKSSACSFIPLQRPQLQFCTISFLAQNAKSFLSYTVKNKNPVQSSQNTITYICFIQKTARILHENVYVYVQFIPTLLHSSYDVLCGLWVPALCSKYQQINCRCILNAPMYFASTRE